MSPNLFLSKVKLNLYSAEDEFLLHESIKSSNSLNFSSLNNNWYWLIFSKYIFSSSFLRYSLFCSFNILFLKLSLKAIDSRAEPGVGVLPGVGVWIFLSLFTIVDFNLIDDEISFLLSFSFINNMDSLSSSLSSSELSIWLLSLIYSNFSFTSFVKQSLLISGLDFSE